jgi:hypothetical protein
MTPKTISTLLGADERLEHQIVNTFATVGANALSWTEKVWASIARRDGSLQVDFGLGKYTNRNVMDAFAGVSRGSEQWTVRASRELATDAEATAVGPIAYEVLEPLQRVRFVLMPSEAAAVSFDLEFDARMPVFFEDRDVQFEQALVVSDVIRYHQAGTVSGWIETDGERVEVRPEEWYAVRDHSWGVRENVGERAPDLQPPDAAKRQYHFHWLTSRLERPDGSQYEVAYYFRQQGQKLVHVTGFVNHEDGTQEQVVHMRVGDDLRYDPKTLAFMGATIELTTGGDELTTRSVRVEPISGTGFHLEPAEYRPWKGGRHGKWRGEHHVDGEYIADCDAEIDARTDIGWQLRDRPVRLRAGDAEGVGILESICWGDFPQYIRD